MGGLHWGERCFIGIYYGHGDILAEGLWHTGLAVVVLAETSWRRGSGGGVDVRMRLSPMAQDSPATIHTSRRT